MNIKNLKKCSVCKGSNLEFIPKYEHEDIMLSTLDEAVMRVDNVMLCKDCDAIHFIDLGHVCTEFSVKVIEERKDLGWVSDQELALINKTQKL